MRKFMRPVLVLCTILISLTILPIPIHAEESWLWPVQHYYNISSGYGQRNRGWHQGIDVDSTGVGNITGKPIVATKSGYATTYPNYGTAGNFVSIDHGNGYISRYMHLDSIAIEDGYIERGQIIGYAGNTGNSTGPHLHFDIKLNGEEVNPMPINIDERHTYLGSSAPFSESLEYDYSEESYAYDSAQILYTNQMLEIGQNGDIVSQLQSSLNLAMGTNLPADGEFGPSTEELVKLFQQLHGLEIDGIAGPGTIARLNEICLNQSPSPTVSPVDINSKIFLTVGVPHAHVFGKSQETDSAPIIVEGRTMIPVRLLSESLGATLYWDASAPDTTIVVKDGIQINIYIDSNVARVNDSQVVLDSPAFIENNRTYVPVRFICEALGAQIDWNPDTKTISITP